MMSLRQGDKCPGSLSSRPRKGVDRPGRLSSFVKAEGEGEERIVIER